MEVHFELGGPGVLEKRLRLAEASWLRFASLRVHVLVLIAPVGLRLVKYERARMQQQERRFAS